mmetsp:Transcript_27871/g.52267  ORF Transcript_27871/g.52267 Transcript_27871/m.52267 type:complete len:82 (-) Transcript_27871:8-253(-)
MRQLTVLCGKKNIIVPFSGAERFQEYKKDYNYLLSQLRTRIEMWFGLLTTKWRIFRRNLDRSVAMNSNIVEVGFCLQKFCN